MTLKNILQKSIIELSNCGLKTAELDARVLLKHVIENDESFIFTHSDYLLTNAQYQKLRRLIRRRKKGEPVAYLTRHKEFYGLDFIVNKNVLIPRPETEILVEKALEFLQAKSYKLKAILDIGTGSGCIIISIVKNLPSTTYSLPAKYFATDISPKALEVAKKNARKYEIYDNIRFFHSDLFDNPKLPNKFDLIIANLPYLDQQVKKFRIQNLAQNQELNYEPEIALYAKNRGFSLIKKLIQLLPLKLNDSGIAFIEANNSHDKMIFSFCKKLNLKISRISNDSQWDAFFQISKH